MEDPQDNPNNNGGVPDHHGAMMAVVSGDSEGPSDDEDIYPTSDAAPSDATNTNHQGTNTSEYPRDDVSLYDEKMDQEDEDYVYQHLRGGKHDEQHKSTDTTTNTTTTKSLKKPRNSDAIISCPACFSTLSMDTQKHYRYHNQYRAMFVMGITVDWQHRLTYDDQVQGLVRWHPPPANSGLNENDNTAQLVAPDHCAPHQPASPPIYYAVFCANCQTMVAALDMTDEVYHFYDCLASS